MSTEYVASGATSQDQSNTRLVFDLAGSQKWGYFVRIWDADGPDGCLSLYSAHKTLDWGTPKEAAVKAAAVLRELADLIEAAA